MAYVLVRLWFGAFEACNAPVIQLQGYRDLCSYAKQDEDVSCAIISRMNANHLWYVLEEFVPVSLVSTILDDPRCHQNAMSH